MTSCTWTSYVNLVLNAYRGLVIFRSSEKNWSCIVIHLTSIVRQCSAVAVFHGQHGHIWTRITGNIQCFSGLQDPKEPHSIYTSSLKPCVTAAIHHADIRPRNALRQPCHCLRMCYAPLIHAVSSTMIMFPMTSGTIPCSAWYGLFSCKLRPV